MSHKVAVALLHGLGGSSTSPGIDLLHNEIAAMSPDIAVLHPYDQDQWQQAFEDLKKYTVEKLVVIGYSMGANATTFVADALKPRHVALLVAIQPTVWENADVVPPTVDRAIEVYNPSFAATAGFGSRELLGRVIYVKNNDTHPYADNDPEVHKLFKTEIAKLL
jgi:pimeloyl-ACP methyl ester carboxylesterase